MYNHAYALLQCVSYSIDKLVSCINITNHTPSHHISNSTFNTNNQGQDQHNLTHFMFCLNNQKNTCHSKLNDTA